MLFYVVSTTGLDGFMGPELIWMDNVYCSGEEQALALCLFDGWKLHDCTTNEAAGVVCKTRANQTIATYAVDPVTNRVDTKTGIGSNQSSEARDPSQAQSQALAVSNDAPLLQPLFGASNTRIRVIVL